MGRSCGKNGRWKTLRADAQTECDKEGEEDNNCNGRVSLRETWKEREKIGNKEQHREGKWSPLIENVVREK